MSHARPGAGALALLATAAGAAAGRVLRWRRVLPGVAAGVLASVACGEITGHLFRHGLAPWAGCLVGSLFLLALDRRL